MTKRLDEIRSLLYARKEVSVQELSRYYKVSAVSIRKDLGRLEQEGVLKRIYGGGILAEDCPPESRTPAICFDSPILWRLAEAACCQIQDGDVLFLGPGRTCCILAKLLSRFSHLSVVTNNVSALGDLFASGARVYLLGGEVTSADGKTRFAAPEDPGSFPRNIRVNKAFTSIRGIDPDKGLTVDSLTDTYLYRFLPSVAGAWIVMADSSKFGRMSMYSAAPLSAVQCLITDRCPDDFRDRLAEAGIRLVTAEGIPGSPFRD